MCNELSSALVCVRQFWLPFFLLSHYFRPPSLAFRLSGRDLIVPDLTTAPRNPSQAAGGPGVNPQSEWMLKSGGVFLVGRHVL